MLIRYDMDIDVFSSNHTIPAANTVTIMILIKKDGPLSINYFSTGNTY